MKEVTDTAVIGNHKSLHLSDPQASWTLGCEVPAFGTSSISKTIGLEILKRGLEEINRTQYRGLRNGRVRNGSAFFAAKI